MLVKKLVYAVSNHLELPSINRDIRLSEPSASRFLTKLYCQLYMATAVT